MTRSANYPEMSKRIKRRDCQAFALLLGEPKVVLHLLAGPAFRRGMKVTLINSTVTANCCVMRCSECSHMFEYAVLPVLLLLALHSPQRVTQSHLKSHLQQHRHLRANARLTIDYIKQSTIAHSQRAGGLGDAQPHRFEAQLPYDFARVGRVMHVR